MQQALPTNYFCFNQRPQCELKQIIFSSYPWLVPVDVTGKRSMHFCSAMSSGPFCPCGFAATSVFWSGILSDTLASLEKRAAFHYRRVVQHAQHRAEHRMGRSMQDRLSCGTGARLELRSHYVSFKKYVCITDDLSEEMTVLPHFSNQIWPALHCTGWMSVQLSWLLCIQWQEHIHSREEPDSPQLHMAFGELISLFYWEVLYFPLLACASGVRENYLFIYFIFKAALLTWCPQGT